MQKNDKHEEIPLLPGFEPILLQTPEHQRRGWIFNPVSLQLQHGRPAPTRRPNADWIGKVISRIGKQAGIEVAPENTKTGLPAKHA